MEFKTGDVVQLRSGGPFMTVSGIESTYVYCTWFDNEQKVVTGKFNIYMLALSVRRGD